MNKMFKVLETAWLVIGCIGIIMCVYYAAVKDMDAAIYFLIFTLVSGLMYALRRRQRVKFEKMQQNKDQKQ